MKQYLFLALAVALAMVLTPLAMGGAALKNHALTDSGAADASPEANDGGEEVIAVFMPEANETETMSMRDYVIGCVAAEMPAAYEENALRAQAVASATLARYMKTKDQKDSSLKGAEIAADPGRHQGYFTKEQMKERWGDDFETYYDKIAAAVDETLPYVLCYEDAPIMAAFHAVSSGVTESAETVWNKSLPYLTNTQSEGDKLCPGYASSVTVSPDTLRETLGLSPDGKPENEWLGEAVHSQAGTLLSLQICGKETSGAELRKLFSLRSAAVSIRYDGDNFILDVTGYGHGVGMSQYGADYYARQGWSWREILAHYYPGATLEKRG